MCLINIFRVHILKIAISLQARKDRPCRQIPLHPLPLAQAAGVSLFGSSFYVAAQSP
jgi:hypothetical protein